MHIHVYRQSDCFDFSLKFLTFDKLANNLRDAFESGSLHTTINENIQSG